MSRRPDGALERAVLAVLWSAPEALTPSEVLEGLGEDLAYTTIMTVLARLHDKGVVGRTRRGRAYAYTALVTESQLVATRMAAELSASSDRLGALSGFVSGLNRREVDALREMIEGREP